MLISAGTKLEMLQLSFPELGNADLCRHQAGKASAVSPELSNADLTRHQAGKASAVISRVKQCWPLQAPGWVTSSAAAAVVPVTWSLLCLTA